MRKKLYLFILLISFLFLLTGCQNSNEEDLNQKAISEIEYFEVKLINILNSLNNITFENYKMIAEKKELDEETAQQEKSSSSGTTQNSDESSSGGESSSGESNTSKEEKPESPSIISSQMAPNTILNPETDEIDWESIKNEIENLYFSWNTVILDLYKLNVDSEDILEFSSGLDTAASYIKNEDKENSLTATAGLFSYLPKYLDTISDDTEEKSILQTKSYILNCYALVGQNLWEDAQTEIAKAEEVFRTITTNVEFAKRNPYKVNKTFVLINELKNSMPLNDAEIFYIKYRNLLEEIINL